jgi:hypothetical protein
MTDNGQQPDTIELPRELLQAVLDYLGTCPAGQVYPLLRALDEQLGIGAQSRPLETPVDAGT